MQLLLADTGYKYSTLYHYSKAMRTCSIQLLYKNWIFSLCVGGEILLLITPISILSFFFSRFSFPFHDAMILTSSKRGLLVPLQWTQRLDAGAVTAGRQHESFFLSVLLRCLACDSSALPLGRGVIGEGCAFFSNDVCLVLFPPLFSFFRIHPHSFLWLIGGAEGRETKRSE